MLYIWFHHRWWVGNPPYGFYEWVLFRGWNGFDGILILPPLTPARLRRSGLEGFDFWAEGEHEWRGEEEEEAFEEGIAVIGFCTFEPAQEGVEGVA